MRDERKNSLSVAEQHAACIALRRWFDAQDISIADAIPILAAALHTALQALERPK